MSFREISEQVLAIPFVLILLSSIFITLKTRFIQLRMLPRMGKLFWDSIFGKHKTKDTQAIQSHKALFTAMSTTIGIGNIVGPVIAIKLGGPGALLLFLIAAFFGAATTFAEVTFALNYRKKLPDGSFMGGPMQYLKQELSPFFANIYAYAGAILLVVWTSNQSNTLADVLSSFHISKYITAVIMTIIVTFYLSGGIKRIGNLASKIVPFMFILYCSASLWILLVNAHKLPGVFKLMIDSVFSISAVTGATVGISLQRVLRWGLAKGTQITEAGVGTATIPHSQSSTTHAINQGILSMISVYSVGFICLLSGLVTLVTNTWQDPSINLGINMITRSFSMYFQSSAIILAGCAWLFALGTILGNAYNGSQCYLYITKNRWINTYYFLIAVAVFWGAILDVEFIWTITDFFIIPVALPNLIGLTILTIRRGNLLKIK